MENKTESGISSKETRAPSFDNTLIKGNRQHGLGSGHYLTWNWKSLGKKH